MQEEKYYNN